MPRDVPWSVVLQEARERLARAQRDLDDLSAVAHRSDALVGSKREGSDDAVNVSEPVHN